MIPRLYVGACKSEICRRLVISLDMKKTGINALAAISPEKAAIPMHFDSDKASINACLRTSGVINPETARIVRVKSTASLEFLQISEALGKEKG